MINKSSLTLNAILSKGSKFFPSNAQIGETCKLLTAKTLSIASASNLCAGFKTMTIIMHTVILI